LVALGILKAIKSPSRKENLPTHLHGWEEFPNVDGTMLCVLAERDLQEKQWNAGNHGAQQIRNQERTCNVTRPMSWDTRYRE